MGRAGDRRLRPTTLIRRVRPVPFGTDLLRAAGIPEPSRRSEPVDLLIHAGEVTAIGPDLPADGVDLVLEADGRWAIPGLWDAHVHLRQWAQTRTRLDVGPARSAAEVCELLARHLATLPEPGSVVFGYGHRSAVWPDRPTVAELDAISGAHPVLLTSGDAHNGWLNSAALRLIGLTERTGPLAENEWFAVMPAVTTLAGETIDDSAAMTDAVADAAARGVVGITDFELALGYREWPERFARGIDRLRVRPAIYPDGLEAVIAAGLRTGDQLPGTGGLGTMGPLKIISDGSLNTRTAYCFEPYVGARAGDHRRGVQNYDRAQLRTLLERATANGLQVAVHAIGDAAAQLALTVFDATKASGGIEHAQLVRPEDIRLMGALGLRASVQPAHLLDDRDVAARCWSDRMDRCFPFGSLTAAGVELAFGSDAPVAALDPWLAMAAAVHRSADDREPWNPAEALTVGQALAASTDAQPTIGLGSRGDVVLLDDDPLRELDTSAAAAAHLIGIGVAATVLAGRPTHLAL
jgi:predicted amidohydrolase YtcJ